MDIFKSCRASFREALDHKLNRQKGDTESLENLGAAQDPKSSRQEGDTESLKNLGATVIFAAEVAYDLSLYDSESEGYKVNFQECLFKLVRCNNNHEELGAFERIHESKSTKMTTFHDEVVRPLVEWFRNESGEADTGEAGPSLKDYYAAFYYYQSACSLCARFQKDENGVYKDWAMPRYGKRAHDIYFHNKMLSMIQVDLCGKWERRILGEIADWVGGHYSKVIDHAQTTRREDCPKRECKILANLLALHGLDHLLRNRFLDRLDIEKLVKELVEADDLLIHQCFTIESFVLDHLKDMEKLLQGCVSYEMGYL
ncbi:hypothetical protein J3E69DRAFT_375125 [Trichoderma sp. SZMC 28015]